jgi:hypothetical protein
MVPGLVRLLQQQSFGGSHWALYRLLPCDSGRQLVRLRSVLPLGGSERLLAGPQGLRHRFPACRLPRSAVKSAGRAPVPERHGTGARDERRSNAGGLGLQTRKPIPETKTPLSQQSGGVGSDIILLTNLLELIIPVILSSLFP